MAPVAWYYDNSGADQREPHKCEPNREVSSKKLDELGVLQFHIDVTKDDHLEKIDALSAERKYKNRDVINIRKDLLPNYEEKIKTFFEEHIHEDEEIRFILEGSGYFDVRDKDDQWIRIHCHASDMIILPAGMYHRFTLDTNNHIKAMRLFKEDPKWTPLNRSNPDTDSNKFRIDYVDTFIKNAKKRAADEEVALEAETKKVKETPAEDKVEIPAVETKDGAEAATIA